MRLVSLSHIYTLPKTRALSLFTIERLFVENSVGIWNRLTPKTKSNLKEILLVRLFDEKDPSVLRDLCHGVVALAVYVLMGDEWPEFECYIRCWLSTEGSVSVAFDAGAGYRILDDKVDSMIPGIVKYFTEGFGGL